MNLIKKIIINIFYFCLINVLLFMGHIWALFGVAFNDTSVVYDTVIKAIPTILFGITPLIIGTIIFTFAFKNKQNFNVYMFLVLQFLIIIAWSLFYIQNYVPSSQINSYINSKIDHKNIDNQNKINEQIINELKKGYVLIDSISNQNQGIAFYFNKQNRKIIVELTINQEKNYNMITAISKDTVAESKITKYDSDYYFEFDKYDNLSVCNGSECYYTYSNCEIKDNTYDYSRYLSIYTSDGEKYNPIEIYKNLVRNSIRNNENIYYFDEDKVI